MSRTRPDAESLAPKEPLPRAEEPGTLEISFETLFDDLNTGEPGLEQGIVQVGIGRGLARARHQGQMSQKEVAQRMGVAQSVVARLESGQSNPKYWTLRRYAKAVGQNLDELVKWIEANASASLQGSHLASYGSVISRRDVHAPRTERAAVGSLEASEAEMPVWVRSYARFAADLGKSIAPVALASWATARLDIMPGDLWSPMRAGNIGTLAAHTSFAPTLALRMKPDKQYHRADMVAAVASERVEV